MSELTLGDLFDGIGGWLDAAIRAGVKPIWAAEIEPFPCAVTAHHYPDVVQLGDITKIDVENLEPVDIVCAGSPCFVAGTSIQTIHGIKPIEKVGFGEQVIGDDCDWHTVIKTMINLTDAIYTINAQGLLETKVTANHPIYVRHMKRHYPTYENGKRGNERVFSEPEYVAVKDLQKGDFVGFPILKSSENVCNITKEEAWLIGRYVADGYVNNSPRKDRPNTNHKVIFCIGKGKVENFKAHIDKYHVCLKKDATCTKGEIISNRLMGLCLLCGKGAGNKEIPSIFLDLPKDLLKALLDGYMSGDGCKNKNVNKATTISKKLALSLQIAVHKVYQLPVKIYFCKRPSKGFIQGREVNQHDTYHVVWLDTIPKQSNAVVINDYIWQPIRSVTKEDIQTTVYNLEVEGVHSYVANGIMTHNCQDLSVAGKREGLAGERSGLFRTAIDIVHKLRARTGRPRYFVWENVPGAFSSNKGFDFKAVIEEIIQTEIPMPSGGKWAESGLVEWGGTSSLAWRTIDAQYWGVPQRRKRIFLVADFRGFTAGEILFVESGLLRNSAESGEKRQDTSKRTGGRTDKSKPSYCISGNIVGRQPKNGGNQL